MQCFDNDEDDLEYLTSLMSDDDCDDEAKEEGSLRCSTNVEKPKSRTESGVFDEELDTVAKSRKRKLSQETQRAHKKRRRGESQQENENKTALLEGEWRRVPTVS